MKKKPRKKFLFRILFFLLGVLILFSIIFIYKWIEYSKVNQSDDYKIYVKYNVIEKLNSEYTKEVSGMVPSVWGWGGMKIGFKVYRQDNTSQHPWVRRVVEPTQQSRRLFREQMNSWGYQFVADQGYYAFVRIAPWLRDKMTTVSTLPQHLTSEQGLAIIPGSVFHQPEFIRFSLANTPEVTLGAMNRLHSALQMIP